MARMPKARTFTTSWCSINSEQTGPPSRCSGTGGHMRTSFPELPNSRRKTSRVEAPNLIGAFLCGEVAQTLLLLVRYQHDLTDHGSAPQ
jgi:hypothetical protein